MARGRAAEAALAHALQVATVALTAGGLLGRRRPLVTVPPGRGGLVLLSGALLAAHFLAWVASLKHTSVLSSVVLVTLNPLFVGFASYLLFREPIQRNLLAGLALAAAGVGLISWADRHDLTCELLAIGTSADTCGDPDRVVGYGAFAVFGGA